MKTNDLKKVMDEILPKEIPRRNGIIEEIMTELKSSDHDIQPVVKKEEELDIPLSPSNIDDEVSLIERTDDTIIVEDEEGDIDNQNVADAAISSTSVPSKIYSSSPKSVRSLLLLPDNNEKNHPQGVGVSPKRAVRLHL